MDPSLGCLVCSSQFKAKKTPVISKSNFEIYLKRLFQYLLIPKSLATDLSEICTQEKFCTSCLESAQEIIDLQAQVAALEMQIQYRVENMGKAVVAVTSELEENSVEGITEMWSDVTQQLWLKFRFPVIQSFAKGLLPTPSVVMKQCPIPTISRQLQAKKLEEHNKKKGSKLNLGSKRKPSSDSVKTFYCPVCPYKQDLASTINSQSALRKVRNHYLSNHNPVRIKDVSIDSEGKECYLCQLCPFKASVAPQRQGDPNRVLYQRKQNALQAHSRHHMRLHSEDINVRNRGTSSAPANPLQTENAPATSSSKLLSKRKCSEGRSFIKLLKIPDLVDGKYYFTCPFPNCDFCYSSDYTETDSQLRPISSRVQYGLRKLGDHYIRSHSSKQQSVCSDADTNDPYGAFLKVVEGSCLLQCPWSDIDCSFSLKVAENNSKKDLRSTYYKFSRHYAVHVYNESYNSVHSKQLSKTTDKKERSAKRNSSLAGLKLAKSKYRKKPISRNNGKGLEKLNLKIGRKRKVPNVK